MRNGVVDDDVRIYFRVLAACTSFSKTMRELAVDLRTSDPLRGKLSSVWRKTETIRVGLLAHPLVLEARKTDGD